MTHGTMQDGHGCWRRVVWYDWLGRKHTSLSVPRRRVRLGLLEWLMVWALGVAVVGGSFGLLVELVR